MSSRTAAGKNDYIELLRFIACLMILMHHSYWCLNGQDSAWFFGGYIFVEFFFMLTGYFTGIHFKKHTDHTNSLSYVAGKAKKLLPITTIWVLIRYIYIAVHDSLSFTDGFNLFLDMPFEMLYARCFGLTGSSYFGHFWYISAMIIVLLVYCWMNQHAPNFFHRVILPIVPALIYGSMVLNTIEGMGHWAIHLPGFTSDILRGFAGIGLGWLAADMTCSISAKPTHLLRTLLTIVELAALGLALYFVWNNAYSAYDVHTLACFFVIILISVSGMSWSSRIHSRLFRVLGKLSLPIYVCHVWTEELVYEFAPGIGYLGQLGLSVLLCIAISALLLLFAQKIWPPIGKALRRAFITEG